MKNNFLSWPTFLFLRPWEAGKAAMRGGFSICYFPFFVIFPNAHCLQKLFLLPQLVFCFYNEIVWLLLKLEFPLGC